MKAGRRWPPTGDRAAASRRTSQEAVASGGRVTAGAESNRGTFVLPITEWWLVRPGVNQTLVSRVSGVRSLIELPVIGNPGESGLVLRGRERRGLPISRPDHLFGGTHGS